MANGGEKKLAKRLWMLVEFRVVGRARGGGTEEKGIAPIQNAQREWLHTEQGRLEDGRLLILHTCGWNRFTESSISKKGGLSSKIIHEAKGFEPYETL